MTDIQRRADTVTEHLPLSRRTVLKFAAATVAATTMMPPRAARASVPHVLADGKLPNDKRLGNLKDYDGYFPWEPLPTVAEWEKRAEFVRRQMLVATGLWPMPTKHPLNAVVHGKVDRDDYTVEKVILQTGDGLYCTGSLYRPKAPATGKRAAVLCPHGHWANGRFHDHGEAAITKEVETKAEHPLQARSVQLARMGCVVFLYDMLGYADAGPLTQQLIHGFSKQREDLSSPERWGLFSAQSELRCLNALGLQTWNSVRALDWISALDDVDPSRIGVTGASGGGTQTFMLGCVDTRPAAFFPAVMVSTSMQGGCTCENASYLRVNTGNIEMTALLAPRPVAMSAADDWTKELETKGLPQLKQHYELLGVPDRVAGKYYPYPHNYNQVARAMMYDFFNKHLKLGIAEPIVERDYVPLTKDEASVWNAEHPAPAQDVEAELRILRGFARDQNEQLARLTPHDAGSLAEFRRVIGGAWDVIIGRKLPGKDDFSQENTFKSDNEDLMKFHTLVRLTKEGEEVPTLFYLPKNWNKQVAIWISDEGKSSLLNEDGTPVAAVQKLIDAGVSVALPDLLYQGEFLADGKPLTEARKVPNPREFVGYTLGFNHPLFCQRVHDVLTLVAFCRFSKYEPSAVHLIGIGKMAGAIAAAAAFQAGKAVDKVVVGTNGFRFEAITNARDPMLVPGAVKYGDVAGLVALCAPRPVWLADMNGAPPTLAIAAYNSSGAADALHLVEGDARSAADSVPGWLVGGTL
jgi:dienelactone hydrolase